MSDWKKNDWEEFGRTLEKATRGVVNSDSVQELKHAVKGITSSDSVQELRHAVKGVVKEVVNGVSDVVKPPKGGVPPMGDIPPMDGVPPFEGVPPFDGVPPVDVPPPGEVGGAPPKAGRGPARKAASRPYVSPVKEAPVQAAPVRPGKKVPNVSVAGILMAVFGFVGLAFMSVFFLAALVMLLTGAFGSLGEGLAAFLLFGGLEAGCAAVAFKGLSLCGRVKRLKVYWREIGVSEFCPVALLASALGRPERYVARDLKRMIRKGLLPGARLDAKKTCLILNPETYQQYLHTEELRRQQQSEQKRQDEAREEDASLGAAVREGEEVIRQIKEINGLIPGAEISRKISHLELVTGKIFDCVEQHPEKLPEIRKFMSYYLPTTLKLLRAYHEFDTQSVQGENIMQAKKEITGALDTVNTAFENLLDSLFEDRAFDVATDISVLETMLAQEGLTGRDDFKEKKDDAAHGQAEERGEEQS